MDNEQMIREVHAALGRGDLLSVMGRVSRNVRWAVNAADRDAAPWFGVYEGKAQLPAYFEALATVTFTDFTLKAVAAAGDVVMAWSHVAFTTPNGAEVATEEVHVWTIADGKIAAVDILLDTGAVAGAFR